MTLQKLAYVFFALMTLLLVGVPLLAGSLGLAPFAAFSLWVNLWGVAYSVTWLGVALILFKKTRAAGIAWISVGLVFGAFATGLKTHLASYPALTVISNDLYKSAEYLSGSLTDEAVESHQKHYSHLKPLALTGSQEDVWRRLQKVVNQVPSWQVLHTNEKDRTMSLAARDRLFGLTDHMDIRLVSLAPEVQSLHITMKSEMDLGAGERRLNRLADFLKGF